MPVGTYLVTATDAYGCTVTNSYTITQPQPISFTPTISAPSCGSADGNVSIVATGGTGPYTYKWNTGNSTQSLTNVAAG